MQTPTQRMQMLGALSALVALTACGGANNAVSEDTSVVVDDGTATTAAASTWVRIATERQNFTVSGQQPVRYGANNRWVVKTVDTSGSCTNAFFGSDPVPGTRKACYVQKAPAPAPAPGRFLR